MVRHRQRTGRTLLDLTSLSSYRNVVGTVILLNILIALYNDSFSRIEEEATGKYIPTNREMQISLYIPDVARLPHGILCWKMCQSLCRSLLFDRRLTAALY